MRSFSKHTIILVLLAAITGLFAQTAPGDLLTVELISSRAAVQADTPLEIALIIDIQHPWHVYAPQGNDEFTIPVQPTLQTEGQPFIVGDWQYPSARLISVAGVAEPAAVYGDRLVIRTTLTPTAQLPDTLQLKGDVYYQACDDAQCLIPTSIGFSLALPVVSATGASQAINSEFFPDAAATIPAEEALASQETEDEDITGLVDKYGMFLTFGIIFLGGLLLNLTPCVYPLIPITISFFGGKDTSKGRTFWMALAYVLGIAVTYSILGVVAALGGGLFGALLTNPIVLIGIAVLLVGLSLSMFGVYEFRLPTGLMTAASQSKAGIFGSFFMGLTLGIVAAPCVGPFVIGLLTYVAAQQSVVLGFTMFFTLALGLGLPYLFLAMYSSKISSLPRSGTWMIGVRVIFGLVLIAMAIYFIMPLLGAYSSLVMALFLIGSGVYLIMIDRNAEGNAIFSRIKQAIAIILVILGTWLAVPEPEHVGAEIAWSYPTSDQQLEQLLASSKPVMIDVFADWCIPCKEMDNITFPDPAVVQLSEKFTAIKINMTQQKGQFQQDMLKRFAIKGVPTYIFLKGGRELSNLRSTGFEKAPAYLKRMQRAL